MRKDVVSHHVLAVDWFFWLPSVKVNRGPSSEWDIRPISWAFIISNQCIFESGNNLVHKVCDLTVWPVLHNLSTNEEISSLIELSDIWVKAKFFVSCVGSHEFWDYIVADVVPIGIKVNTSSHIKVAESYFYNSFNARMINKML